MTIYGRCACSTVTAELASYGCPELTHPNQKALKARQASCRVKRWHSLQPPLRGFHAPGTPHWDAHSKRACGACRAGR